MKKMIFISTPSWSYLFENYDSITKQCLHPPIILLPSSVDCRTIQEKLSTNDILKTTDILEKYVHKKHGIKYLLSKQSIENLLLSIIFQSSSSESKNEISRYLDIETYHQGYIKALNEFIIDFRENGPQNLLDALNTIKSEALSAKERDLIDIHDELENTLHHNNLFDYRRAILDFLGDKEKGQPSFFLPEYQDATLVILGFNRLTFLESKLIGWLVFRFQQSVFTYCKNERAADVSFRYQNSNQVFIEKAKQVFQDNVQDINLTEDKKSTLSDLAQLLFNDDKPVLLTNDQNVVQIYQANDRFSEITHVAYTIRQLHANGISYQNMQVILSNYETYTSLLQEIFPRYGIPFNLPTGIPLAFFPLAQLILNLMNHAVMPNPFSLREHIFSSPYISFSLDVTADDLHKFIDNINNQLSTVHDIIDEFLPSSQNFTLKYSWLQSTQKKAAQYVRSKEDLHPLEMTTRYLEKIYPEVKQHVFQVVVNSFLLTRAEKALYVWRTVLTPAEFLKSFEKLLQRFQIEKNIYQYDLKQDHLIGAIIEQDKAVMSMIRELLKVIEQQFTVLSTSKDKTFALADIIHSFSGLLSESEFHIAHVHEHGVRINTTTDMTIRYLPITFITGLVDGEFPAQEPFNFLQPRKDGQSISPAETFVDRDRHILYQLIAATTDQLHITYPISDGSKKLLVSPFVAEIKKCLSNEIQSVTHDPKHDFSLRDKLIYINSQIDQAYESAIPLLKEIKRNSPDIFDQIIAIFECDGLRASIDNFSRFDGVFNTSAAIDSIKKKIDEHYIFNADKLERFAGCPLRFLFDDLMHLKPDFIYDYHPDQTERGVLMKKILTEFTGELVKKDEKVQEHEAEILLDIAKAAIDQFLNEKEDLFNDRFKNGLIRGLSQESSEKNIRPGLLAAFLNYERTSKDMIEPFMANISFSNNDNQQFKIDHIPIEIEIDRIDRTSNGKHVIVYEYSIADFGDVEGIGKGLKFKLPLKILACRDHLKNIPETVAGAGIYLVKNYRNIKRGGYFALKSLQATREDNVSEETPIFSGQRKFGFLPTANFEDELKNITERVKHIVNLIHKGRFHLPICTMKDQICLNCHFDRICRKDQLRLDKLYMMLGDKEVYKPKRRLVE